MSAYAPGGITGRDRAISRRLDFAGIEPFSFLRRLLEASKQVRAVSLILTRADRERRPGATNAALFGDPLDLAEGHIDQSAARGSGSFQILGNLAAISCPLLGGRRDVALPV